ncbi:MAG: proprotein convertase P-domain-containing protein, partial [Deltaproteobacteria bacterium]|nr:proprotein convertase P-domain-containing protein [Deltaproteobacteria bacterium]
MIKIGFVGTVISVGIALTFIACNPQNDDSLAYPPLASMEDIRGDAPDPSSLPRGGKADQVFPSKFDLLASQTRVKDQGERGLCTFFASTALTESLYIANKEEPASLDLSEQYAVWLLKEKHHVAPHRSSSDVLSNLTAFADDGIIKESLWEYDPMSWIGYGDCKSNVSPMPTDCFTQGSPPPEATKAKKFKIGHPFHVNTYRNTLKHHLFGLKSPIVISMPIHCQAWNYASKCPLVTDLERWNQGIVSYPNKEDRDFLSTKSPSGHSLLIVGWDDDFAVPARDKDGETVLDDNGNPVMERGFFIVKNSWGTRNFGSKNVYAKGYALISMKYVEEFATAIAAPWRDKIEICDDGKDNNGNNYVDCEDSYCKSHKACIGKNQTFSTIVEKEIPDGKDSGILSEVLVKSERVADRLVISVKIVHPDPSQLVISVKDMTGGNEHVLWDRESAKGGVFQRSFYSGDYWDQMISDVFQLKVRDVEPRGVGTLVSWGVTVEPCEGDDCENGYKDVGNY